MTHASHYRLDRSFFILNNFNCEREVIAESWAEGVETIVTNHRYRGLSNNYNSVASNSLYGYPELGYNGFRQDQSVGEMTEYTPLVIDLHDNFNQNNQISSSLPNDRVKNFTLLQMQRALNDSRGLVTWRQRLKNQPTVNSDVFIDELFNEYPFQLCE